MTWHEVKENFFFFLKGNLWSKKFLAEIGSTSLNWAKIFSEKTDGWSQKEGFKQGITWEGESNQQPCEAVNKGHAVVWQGRNHKINKISLMWGHLQHLLVGKKVPIRNILQKSLRPFSRMQHIGVPLLSACVPRHTVCRINYELEMCAQLQGYDLIGIGEVVDGSHDWSVAVSN